MAEETGNGQDLDQGQYDVQSIIKYESVYGRDFVSPGGAGFARELIGLLDLDGGSRVLDAGCGLGGAAFLMAGEFGLRVDGIDLSRNMIELARERLDAHGLHKYVSLEQGDCLDLELEDAYDAVYSRDVFLHIHDKNRLFAVLYRVLRPGGKLLFTDYCCGERPWSEGFADYVADRDYDLHNVDEYAALVGDAGFADVHGRDISARFADILEIELQRIGDPDSGCDPVLAASWQEKLARVKSGEHRWGLVTASKPRRPASNK